MLKQIIVFQGRQLKMEISYFMGQQSESNLNFALQNQCADTAPEF